MKIVPVIAVHFKLIIGASVSSRYCQLKHSWLELGDSSFDCVLVLLDSFVYIVAVGFLGKSLSIGVPLHPAFVYPCFGIIIIIVSNQEPASAYAAWTNVRDEIHAVMSPHWLASVGVPPFPWALLALLSTCTSCEIVPSLLALANLGLWLKPVHFNSSSFASSTCSSSERIPFRSVRRRSTRASGFWTFASKMIGCLGQ